MVTETILLAGGDPITVKLRDDPVCRHNQISPAVCLDDRDTYTCDDCCMTFSVEEVRFMHDV